ncbi:glutathione S-transferase kappa 1-like [Acipenser ruthenus]|uniref:glutathione S-transferase kappa 1-like n=1 Tax=Acipenser ruthenus TaxID=7906 RepID=UPI002742497E|nr:glutathione S-transferase kappa 1-like [Acipenser ruthenus]
MSHARGLCLCSSLYVSGNKPPGLVPNKPLYMTKNLQRLASYCKVPIQAASNPFEAMFEKGSLSEMQFVTVVEENLDQDITTPESLQEVRGGWLTAT